MKIDEKKFSKVTLKYCFAIWVKNVKDKLVFEFQKERKRNGKGTRQEQNRYLLNKNDISLKGTRQKRVPQKGGTVHSLKGI